MHVYVVRVRERRGYDGMEWMRGVVIAGVLAAVAGCGGAGPPPVSEPEPAVSERQPAVSERQPAVSERQPAVPQPAAACGIGDSATALTLSVAVGQAADAAHAPAPRTPAERLIFRQLYETLVRIDCAGTVLSGLAESWSADEQGRVWQFRLRAGAVFSDGSPVTARAVMDSWSGTPHVSAAFASVTAVGERELRVELRAPALQPYLFAHADLAVARRSADVRWPIGSGAFRIDAGPDARVTRIVQRSARASAPQVIEFRTVASTDARAGLDAGVDVLVTADPPVVAYARALPAYTVSALPWSRTYVLAGRLPDRAADTIMGPPADALVALARDAVPGGARVAVPPFWWDTPDCPLSSPAQPARAPAHASARTVLYPRGDAIARGIAERVVALGWPAARAPAWLRALLPRDYPAAGAPIAVAIEERGAVDSLRTGRALAVVVPLPRSAATACAAGAVGGASAALGLIGTGEWRITPLLDAHDYLVHRTSFGRITVESDGTILFGGGGS